MAGTKYSELFVQAKRVMRQHPSYSDEQIADLLCVHKSDPRAMDTLREARRDIQVDLGG